MGLSRRMFNINRPNLSFLPMLKHLNIQTLQSNCIIKNYLNKLTHHISFQHCSFYMSELKPPLVSVYRAISARSYLEWIIRHKNCAAACRKRVTCRIMPFSAPDFPLYLTERFQSVLLYSAISVWSYYNCAFDSNQLLEEAVIANIDFFKLIQFSKLW